MKIYEAKNLKKTIHELREEFEDGSIYLQVNKTFEKTINVGTEIKLSDIKRNTDFFRNCIVKEYQELIKKVYKNRWSLDVSEIKINRDIHGRNEYVLVVKVSGE